MAAALTRCLLLATLLLTLVTVASADLSCSPGCVLCINGFCKKCSMGYYLYKGATCVPCETEHCRSCTYTNICVDCEEGYHLSYTESLPDSIDEYPGVCVSANTGSRNAAMHRGLPSMLIVLVAIVTCMVVV